MIDLISLQNKIHQQNKKAGWWDRPRPFSTMICLFHSELSEAMEGDRKNLMDDHLPQYPMFQVELADFAIRCMDYLGSVNFDDYDQDDWRDIINPTLPAVTDILAQLHSSISSAWEKHEQGDKKGIAYDLGACVECCFYHAELAGFDLLKIINEKVEYNRNRADHKRENRAKEGGKKY